MCGGRAPRRASGTVAPAQSTLQPSGLGLRCWHRRALPRLPNPHPAAAESRRSANGHTSPQPRGPGSVPGATVNGCPHPPTPGDTSQPPELLVGGSAVSAGPLQAAHHTRVFTRVQPVRGAPTTQAQGPAWRAPSTFPGAGAGRAAWAHCPSWGPRPTRQHVAAGGGGPAAKSAYVYIALQTRPRDPGPPGEHGPSGRRLRSAERARASHVERATPPPPPRAGSQRRASEAGTG